MPHFQPFNVCIFVEAWYVNLTHTLMATRPLSLTTETDEVWDSINRPTNWEKVIETICCTVMFWWKCSITICKKYQFNIHSVLQPFFFATTNQLCLAPGSFRPPDLISSKSSSVSNLAKNGAPLQMRKPPDLSVEICATWNQASEPESHGMGKVWLHGGCMNLNIYLSYQAS